MSCDRLSWPFHQLLSARRHTISYRVLVTSTYQSTCRAEFYRPVLSASRRPSHAWRTWRASSREGWWRAATEWNTAASTSSRPRQARCARLTSDSRPADRGWTADLTASDRQTIDTPRNLCRLHSQDKENKSSASSEIKDRVESQWIQRTQ